MTVNSCATNQNKIPRMHAGAVQANLAPPRFGAHERKCMREISGTNLALLEKRETSFIRNAKNNNRILMER